MAVMAQGRSAVYDCGVKVDIAADEDGILLGLMVGDVGGDSVASRMQ
jgi:hypothetical protein